MTPLALVLTCLIGLHSNFVATQVCLPRKLDELVINGGFENGEEEIYWNSGSPIMTEPQYPAHSGVNTSVLSAYYYNSGSGASNWKRGYIDQFLPRSRSGIQYQVGFTYSMLSYDKGDLCPDAELPLANCSLKASFAVDTVALIPIEVTSGYIELSIPFVPTTSGRYIGFELSCICNPFICGPGRPGCSKATLLLDDISFLDLGKTCGWTALGCYTDSVATRALEHHGMIESWPYATTVEACQGACAKQGFSYAGLEFGNECWCGDELVNSDLAPDGNAGCNMLCSGDDTEICGGPDRLSLYHLP